MKNSPDLNSEEDSGAPTMLERPDGFYWQDSSTGKVFGPFSTLQEAEEDMAYQVESDFEEGESLEEAEDEIGILSWIDPDTGYLAEDIIPHLNDE